MIQNRGWQIRSQKCPLMSRGTCQKSSGGSFKGFCLYHRWAGEHPPLFPTSNSKQKPWCRHDHVTKTYQGQLWGSKTQGISRLLLWSRTWCYLFLLFPKTESRKNLSPRYKSPSMLDAPVKFPDSVSWKGTYYLISYWTKITSTHRSMFHPLE